MPLIHFRDFVPTPPPIPETIVVPEDFTPQQAEEVTRALDLLKLWKLPDGTFRSETSLNRLGQRRWPDRSIIIDVVTDIVDAWNLAGEVSLLDMIRKGLYEGSTGRFWYWGVRPEIDQFVVKEITDPIPEEREVFILVGYVIRCAEANHPPEYHVYDVLARGKYGMYHFAVAGDALPESYSDLDHLCCHHNLARLPDRDEDHSKRS